MAGRRDMKNTLRVTLNTSEIVSSSQVGRSRCTGAATAGAFLFNGTGGGAATGDAAGRFCTAGARAGGVGLGWGGVGDGAGEAEVDAVGVVLAPCSLARRFRRIYPPCSAFLSGSVRCVSVPGQRLPEV